MRLGRLIRPPERRLKKAPPKGGAFSSPGTYDLTLDPGRSKSKRNRWLTLIAMTISSGMILVDQTSVPLAIPYAMTDLNAPVSDGQWILTANMLPLAAFMVLGGRLGDLLGLRRVFLAGALIFVISSALAGFAQNLPWMITARATQGAGAALMMPTAVAIVSTVFPDEERGKALGLLAGFAAFAAALGPVLGGGLATIDWRLVFLVNVPLAALCVLLTLKACPPLAPKEGASRNLDPAGVITFGIGIAAHDLRPRPGPGRRLDRPAGHRLLHRSRSWPSSPS